MSAWNPQDERHVKLGKRALCWLGRRIKQELERYLNATAPTTRYGALTITGDDIAALVPWFLEDPMRYVRWISHDNYAGKRFSTGVWRFNADAVKGDIVQGMTVLRDKATRAADAQTVATLDDWLRADTAGTLKYVGAKGGGESMRLGPDERRKLFQNALVRRAYWPRPCSLCGEMFRNPAHGQKRCPACLAAKRSARESTKGKTAHRERREHGPSEPGRLALPTAARETRDQASFHRTVAVEALRLATGLQRDALARLQSLTGEDSGPTPGY